MAKVCVSAKKIIVKPKNDHVYLSEKIIKFLVFTLAVAGVNRGMNFECFGKNKIIFFIYTCIGPFVIFIANIIYWMSARRSFLSICRGFLYTLCYFSTIFLAISKNPNKIIEIYNKLYKLKPALFVKEKIHFTKIYIVTFVIVIFCSELYDLIYSILKMKTKGPLGFSLVTAWYVFFVVHLDCIWRYVFINYVRMKLRNIYNHLKFSHNTSQHLNEIIFYKTSLKLMPYSKKLEDKKILEIRSKYETIVFIQESLISILNPTVSKVNDTYSYQYINKCVSSRLFTFRVSRELLSVRSLHSNHY